MAITNPFVKLAQTCVNLLTHTDTAINMVGRVVNSADSYIQVVERHADNYNHESRIVSLKRREQLEQQYKLLTPEQMKLANAANPFDHLELSTTQQ